MKVRGEREEGGREGPDGELHQVAVGADEHRDEEVALEEDRAREVSGEREEGGRERREGGRKGGRDGGREGGTEGGREGGR